MMKVVGRRLGCLVSSSVPFTTQLGNSPTRLQPNSLPYASAIIFHSSLFPIPFSLFISSAFKIVSCFCPTLLPIRKTPLALAFAPLVNHEIYFGCVRFALRHFPDGASRKGTDTCHACTGASVARLAGSADSAPLHPA
jgi:hypothetical protein